MTPGCHPGRRSHTLRVIHLRDIDHPLWGPPPRAPRLAHGPKGGSATAEAPRSATQRLAMPPRAGTQADAQRDHCCAKRGETVQ